MTEITFRFVIELSEDTMQFLWELVDELKDYNNEDESDSRSDSDSTVRSDLRDPADTGS